MSKTKEFGRNTIQAVVPHHLEDDVDEHSSDVNGSHECQASPKLLKCCRRLIVKPSAGFVGHQFIETSATMAEMILLEQQSLSIFIRAEAGSID